MVGLSQRYAEELAVSWPLGGPCPLSCGDSTTSQQTVEPGVKDECVRAQLEGRGCQSTKVSCITTGRVSDGCRSAGWLVSPRRGRRGRAEHSAVTRDRIASGTTCHVGLRDTT